MITDQNHLENSVNLCYGENVKEFVVDFSKKSTTIKKIK